MAILIKIIGIFITAMGVLIFLNPKIMKMMMGFWRKGNNVYWAGLLRFCLGSIFLFGAKETKLPSVVFVVGILMLLGGLFIFLLGVEKSKAIIDRVQKKPEYLLRLLSLIVIAFGTLIIYSA